MYIVLLIQQPEWWAAPDTAQACFYNPWWSRHALLLYCNWWWKITQTCMPAFVCHFSEIASIEVGLMIHWLGYWRESLDVIVTWWVMILEDQGTIEGRSWVWKTGEVWSVEKFPAILMWCGFKVWRLHNNFLTWFRGHDMHRTNIWSLSLLI